MSLTPRVQSHGGQCWPHGLGCGKDMQLPSAHQDSAHPAGGGPCEHRSPVNCHFSSREGYQGLQSPPCFTEVSTL